VPPKALHNAGPGSLEDVDEDEFFGIRDEHSDYR
jgi:hypothetical protein